METAHMTTDPTQPEALAELAAKLTAIEAETLSAWSEMEVGYGFGFRAAAKYCKTPASGIRRAVRALARKGMLEYQRSLYNDDGTMGAGYTITEAGAARLGAIEDARMRKLSDAALRTFLTQPEGE
jgi:hypothetical protein